jgi:hypothetical protein
MSEVGALIIKLQAETAQFRADMGKVKGDLAGLTGQSQDTGRAMDFSMMEAKGSMMLLGEETGVRIPRHLQTLIATIPGVGAAFSAMLPLVGVAAAIGIVAKLIEKHEKLIESIRKTAIENQNIALSEDNVTRSMEVANLKLEDQIAKLEGRPTNNKLKEALIENQSELIKLANSFDTQFQKIDAAIKTGTSTLGNYWQELKNIASMPIYAARNAAGQAVELAAAIDKVSESEDRARDLKDKLNDATGTKAITAATKEYVDELRNVQNYTRLALVVAQEQASPNVEQISALKQQIHSLTAEIKDMGLQAKNLNLKSHLATDENKGKSATEEEYQWVTKLDRQVAETTKKEKEFWDQARRGSENSGIDRYMDDKKFLAKQEEEMIKAGERGVREKEKQYKELYQLAKQQSKATEDLYRKETSAFNEGIAKQIAGSRNLAQAMANIGKQMLSDAIKYALEEIETKIGLHTAFEAVLKMLHISSLATNLAADLAATKAEGAAAAGLAGANATASFALAPWPIDVGAAAFGASMAATAAGFAAFEQGGKIPGEGAIPILGHGGETVVTRALTDRVETAEGKSSARTGNIHMHFAPQIHAVDAEGVDRMLKKHGTVFQRHITGVMRKMNRGA